MQRSKRYAIPGVRTQSYRPRTTKVRQSKKSKKPVDDIVKDPAKILSDLLNLKGLTPAQKAARITIWHRVEQRKIAGTAAPLRRNLAKYLHKNKQCDVYIGQDKFDTMSPGEIDRKTGSVVSEVNRVAIWNPMKRTKITGNAAPLPKNLQSYFARHPGMEVYRGQDLITESLENEVKNKNQSSAHIKKHVPKKDNTPGIHYPLTKTTPNTIEFEWEKMKKQNLPLHMFHEQHELVPESYWTGSTATHNHDGSTPPKDIEATEVPENYPTSVSGPIPFEGGNPVIGTDEHDFHNLDKMSYEDLASSWSNTPMWNDPTCQQKIETGGIFVSAIQADRSLVFDDRPLDFIGECHDISTMDSAENDENYSPPDVLDVIHSDETSNEDVDLFFGDIFVGNCEASTAKDE